VDEVTVPYEQRVYRCDACKGVLYDKHIQEGGCPKCGGRRIQIAVGITDEEAEFLKGQGYKFDAAYWMDEATAVEKQRMEREIR
jgi:DNA-directed RNA polymerase subunit RPC12/RpoP